MLDRADRRSRQDPLRIVLAEDDDEIRWGLISLMVQRGWMVYAAPHGADLLDYLASSMLEHLSPLPDVIISDVRMPGFNGLGILEGLRGAGWLTPFIIITAFGDSDTRACAARLQAKVFDKPIDAERLEAEVVRAAEEERAKPAHERRALAAVLDDLPLLTVARIFRQEEGVELAVLHDDNGKITATGIIRAEDVANDLLTLSREELSKLTVGDAQECLARQTGASARLLQKLARNEIDRVHAVVRSEGPPTLACVERAELNPRTEA
jgi:DNA-binding response OmpR family regulator